MDKKYNDWLDRYTHKWYRKIDKVLINGKQSILFDNDNMNYTITTNVEIK